MSEVRTLRVGLRLGDFSFGNACLRACIDSNCLRLTRCKWVVLAEQSEHKPKEQPSDDDQ